MLTLHRRGDRTSARVLERRRARRVADDHREPSGTRHVTGLADAGLHARPRDRRLDPVRAAARARRDAGRRHGRPQGNRAARRGALPPLVRRQGARGGAGRARARPARRRRGLRPQPRARAGAGIRTRQRAAARRHDRCRRPPASREPALDQFHAQLLERIRAVPGVEAAALAWKPPISYPGGAWTQSIAVDGGPVRPETRRRSTSTASRPATSPPSAWRSGAGATSPSRTPPSRRA